MNNEASHQASFNNNNKRCHLRAHLFFILCQEKSETKETSREKKMMKRYFTKSLSYLKKLRK